MSDSATSDRDRPSTASEFAQLLADAYKRSTIPTERLSTGMLSIDFDVSSSPDGGRTDEKA